MINGTGEIDWLVTVLHKQIGKNASNSVQSQFEGLASRAQIQLKPGKYFEFMVSDDIFSYEGEVTISA